MTPINPTVNFSAYIIISSNVFRFKPGRRFWVVVAGVTAMILMLGGITDHLDNALTFQGVFLMSWAAILVTDFIAVKRIMKIGPGYYEERQEYLHKWNPVGVWSLIISSLLGTIAALGFMGTFLQSTAAFFAAALAAVLTIVLAYMTKGKYYLNDKADEINDVDEKDILVNAKAK
jgi:purine-cytosine permease-like protein